jgi:hypothetical protein
MSKQPPEKRFKVFKQSKLSFEAKNRQPLPDRHETSESEIAAPAIPATGMMWHKEEQFDYRVTFAYHQFLLLYNSESQTVTKTEPVWHVISF